MKKITEKQKIVLESIYKFMLENGYPPTVREISSDLGFLSPKAAGDHMAALQKKGYLERSSLPRSIRLSSKALGLESISKHQNIIKVPLLGRIAAGAPILAEQNIEEYLDLPSDSRNRKVDFALRVEGDSMTGDGINEGDIILVRSQDAAESGDIVVALIGEQATVKRLYLSRDTMELRPSNPSYKPIKIEDNVRIQGKVLSLYRLL